MAYRLKNVRYQNTPRKILLQNENGPCPLLAAANALLLRGVIALPSTCIRNGVASIDDVVNVLADRAIKRSSDHAASAGEWTPVKSDGKNKPPPGSKDKASKYWWGKKESGKKEPDAGQIVDPNLSHDHLHYHEHHLNDLLGLFPSLQYGMDVNPKFTAGPTGVEYTMNLTAFDLLGVDLVHGWLLDPQDKETAHVIGSKSYNELIEVVIHGNEAEVEINRLEGQIDKLVNILNSVPATATKKKTDKKQGAETSDKEETEWVNVTTVDADSESNDEAKFSHVETTSAGGEIQTVDPPASAVSETAPESSSGNSKGTDETVAIKDPPKDETTSTDAQPVLVEEEANETIVPLSDDERKEMIAKVAELREKQQEQSLLAAKGSIVNSFLSSTSHQLTYHGLHELHNYLGEECLCVFFRNNHFSTVTKHDGILYLLVTDLGYANVPEVMWEKLDSIDGDTEYVDEFFAKTKPQAGIHPAPGPTLTPEQMLAQSGQAEADYQLALQLSKNGGRGLSRQELDEQEGRIMAAATEASLREWNDSGGAGGRSNDGTVVPNLSPRNKSLPPLEEEKTEEGGMSSGSEAGKEDTKSPPPPLPDAESDSALEDSDRAMALALQEQFQAEQESEKFARRLQEEENRATRQRAAAMAAARPNAGNGTTTRFPQKRVGTATRAGGDNKSSCVIS